MGSVSNLFGYALNFIYEMIQNYGLAIILFSVLLKIILLPFSIKQQKTMKKSAKLQVKVKEIQEKYSNDQVRQSQEMMDLYKKENMSPFSGCLTSIIQIIIVISVFYLVSKPLTYMKHVDQELLNSYSTEISDSSGELLRYPEISIIKEKGYLDEKVNLNMNFLGLDLSDVPTQNYKDPRVYIIPGLYVITSIISTKLTTSLNKKSKKENTIKEEDKPKEKEQDAMEEMNRQMTIMMPVMAVSIALIAPLGLALYWLVSNILMIVERLVINNLVKDEEEESNG